MDADSIHPAPIVQPPALGPIASAQINEADPWQLDTATSSWHAAAYPCENCGFGAKYGKNPQSFLRRFWRWHAKWRPGWKEYMLSWPSEERIRLAEQYDLQKYQ